MERIKDFHFCYLALAAKHWYVRGENESIYDFVLRLVKLEDKYLVFEHRDRKGQAVNYCLRCLDELAKFYRSNGIERWWDGYCTMKSEVEKYLHLYGVKEYEEAIILFVFNVLMMEDINLPRPIYGKGYPRQENKNGMTYKEMRRLTDFVSAWK